ncbi:MAG: sigma-54 dependent transcriptional regulator [Candidatus Eisenbacteria bacterium]
MSRILLVDDDKSLRGVLAFSLREDGHVVEEAADGIEGLERFREERPDLVIADLKMPRMDGMKLLAAIREEGSETPVIVLTAFGKIEQAVEAMKRGAFHYLTKPYNRDELRVVVRNALERSRLLAENRALRTRLDRRGGAPPLVFVSVAMRSIVETIERVAPTDATVLLTGESGTGKELLARLLHQSSDRKEKPLVAVNCGALPRDLVESELFGHRRGAFTGATRDKPGKFQAASGGTLFLDEIGELPLDLQSKLLRVLDAGEVDMLGGGGPVEVDVRLVAATNRDLERAVREGTFREDLFYRLNVIPIRVPALRERPEDIPVLWRHFVEQFAAGPAVATDPNLLAHLARLPWKGNVRELANLCQRMVLLRKGDALRLADLPEEGRAETTLENVAHESPLPAFREGPLPEGSLPLRELERDVIEKALRKFEGNKSRTARYLGIPRHILLYRIRKYGIGAEP